MKDLKFLGFDGPIACIKCVLPSPTPPYIKRGLYAFAGIRLLLEKLHEQIGCYFLLRMYQRYIYCLDKAFRLLPAAFVLSKKPDESEIRSEYGSLSSAFSEILTTIEIFCFSIEPRISFRDLCIFFLLRIL